jgi:Putative, 10TM heavy-metal exporter
MQLFHAILTALADAFMQVGVFVAVLVGAFGWLRWRHGESIISVLERHRLWGPAIGAVLGVSPGCAGAIMVMPLFARRSVSYGTVIAALVATMGDSSWVIMAANPEMAGVVHGILFLTGLVTGYAVDLLRVRPGVPEPAGGTAVERSPEPARPSASVSSRRPPVPVLARIDTGIEAGIRVEPPGALSLAMRAPVDLTPVVFWMLVLTGFMVAFPTAFQMVDPAVLTSLAGGIDPYLTLGLAGTASAAVLFAVGRGKLADDSAETVGTWPHQPFGSVLRHGAHEVAFVVVWVAVAYVAWACVHVLTGFDGSQLPLLGIAGVLVGALIGLIPGCAVQIVFTGLYVSGIVPLPTLLANALSQDGDALLPLLALDRRSALVATCITTVPGLVVGTGALLLLSR